MTKDVAIQKSEKYLKILSTKKIKYEIEKGKPSVLIEVDNVLEQPDEKGYKVVVCYSFIDNEDKPHHSLIKELDEFIKFFKIKGL